MQQLAGGDDEIENILNRAALRNVSASHAEPPDDGAPWPDKIPDGADGERDDTPPPKRTPPPPPKIEISSLPPLKLDDWRARDLPEPDWIMGKWLSTTSRMLLTAATGLGKTNFGLALAFRVAAGRDFLHWQAGRPARVLYIDGEMSRRLLRQRLLDEEVRLGETPATLHALSHQDIAAFKPLSTPEGKSWLLAFIEAIGGIDLMIADNIMCLTLGDQKDPEVWQQTIPLVHALTKADIGQVWVHHTGHDETRSYGDKSREWQMDCVGHLDAVKRDDTDVSFCLTFKKARERTPATRFDFQDVKIALVNDQWQHELTEGHRRPGKVSATGRKFLDALVNVIGSDAVQVLPGNRRAASKDDWMAELILQRLIEPEAKPDSARSLFSKYRRELISENMIACEEDWSWLRN